MHVPNRDLLRIRCPHRQRNPRRNRSLPTVERGRIPGVIRTSKRFRARKRERRTFRIRVNQHFIDADGDRRQPKLGVGIYRRNNRRARGRRSHARVTIDADIPRRDRTRRSGRIDLVNLAANRDRLSIGNVRREPQHIDGTSPARRCLHI